MKFNPQTFEFVMNNILLKLHFNGNDISSVQDWNISINLSVQDLINARPSETDEIRFILRCLEIADIIKFKSGNMSIIESLTPNGYKWVLKNKYKMQLD